VLFGRFNVDSQTLAPEVYLGVYTVRLSPEQKQAIRDGMEDGEPQHLIASRLGLPRKRVYGWIWHDRARRQVPLPAGYKPDEKYREAQGMWNEGKSVQEIADHYGFAYKRMYGIIERYREAFGWFANRHHREKKLDAVRRNPKRSRKSLWWSKTKG
jgi:hypothetical protein